MPFPSWLPRLDPRAPAQRIETMDTYQQPDASGHFGIYGGTFASETLTHAISELRDAYKKDAVTSEEYYRLRSKILAEP